MQTVKFYDGKDDKGAPALRFNADDGATEGRMIVDRVATDADKAAHKAAWAEYQRKKAESET